MKRFDPTAVLLLFVACSAGALFVIPAQVVTATCQLQLGPKWARYRVSWP